MGLVDAFTDKPDIFSGRTVELKAYLYYDRITMTTISTWEFNEEGTTLRYKHNNYCVNRPQRWLTKIPHFEKSLITVGRKSSAFKGYLLTAR